MQKDEWQIILPTVLHGPVLDGFLLTIETTDKCNKPMTWLCCTWD